jgi:hypothetical protein
MLPHIAYNGEPHSISHELLSELPGDAGSEPEKIIVETLRRYHRQIGSVLQRLAKHFHSVAFAPQLLTIRRNIEGTHAFNST